MGDVLLCIRLTIEDTTSSARIFIKIIFQDLSEKLGLKKIYGRICGSDYAHCFSNIFPRDTTSNIRFSINFFTSIGLGSLTNHQREYLRHLPELLAPKPKEHKNRSTLINKCGCNSSDSGYTDEEYCSSYSD